MENIILKNFQPNNQCPVRDVLSRLGDKWSILILTTLKVNGRLRFSEIQRTIGDISQRMLTATLRSMEADGIMKREVFAEVPPRVEYELTALGHELYANIEPLVHWAEKNIDEILANRQKI